MSRSAFRMPDLQRGFARSTRARMAIAAGCVLGALAIAVPGYAAMGEVPKVVASIKPIHSLVTAVMEGVGTPELIVKGAASPHTYSMKPSDATALQDAAIVFWGGNDLEAFLVKPLATLSTNAEIVGLVDAPGLQTLPFREGGPFEADADEDDGGHPVETAGTGTDRGGASKADGAGGSPGRAPHAHDTDMHFWLDPQNAKAMARAIETTLAAADPAHAAIYRANTDKLDTRLDALSQTTKAALQPVANKPFIVFHDAYQYFEKRFGVTVAGSITVSPDQIPGVRRVAAIRAKVEQLGATCVFAEPQFQPKLIAVVTEGTKARAGVLDPEGSALKDGPELYFQLISNLAASLTTCLSKG